MVEKPNQGCTRLRSELPYLQHDKGSNHIQLWIAEDATHTTPPMGWTDRICTIIDHFTSMIHLAPCRTTHTATDIAELLFNTVYKLHGMPGQRSECQPPIIRKQTERQSEPTEP